MTIIGKTDDGFLVSVTKLELDAISSNKNMQGSDLQYHINDIIKITNYIQAIRSLKTLAKSYPIETLLKYSSNLQEELNSIKNTLEKLDEIN